MLFKDPGNLNIWRNESTTARILNLNTRWKWIVRFLYQSLYPTKRNPAQIYLIRAFLTQKADLNMAKGKIPPSVGNRTPAVLPCLYPVTCLEDCLVIKWRSVRLTGRQQSKVRNACYLNTGMPTKCNLIGVVCLYSYICLYDLTYGISKTVPTNT
jgi:hypothetical protein